MHDPQYMPPDPAARMLMFTWRLSSSRRTRPGMIGGVPVVVGRGSWVVRRGSLISGTGREASTKCRDGQEKASDAW
jgi:hypothetical protein